MATFDLLAMTVVPDNNLQGSPLRFEVRGRRKIFSKQAKKI
jgi:hypothetical protein